MSNKADFSALKEKLYRKYFDEYLFDSSLLQLLYMYKQTFNLAVSHLFLAGYLITHFMSSSPSDEDNCLALFVKKWANEFKVIQYDFLFEDVLYTVDQIRMEDYQMY